MLGQVKLNWIALSICAVRLCKATQEPTSQLAALLRVAQIVHILSAADPHHHI